VWNRHSESESELGIGMVKSPFEPFLRLHRLSVTFHMDFCDFWDDCYETTSSFTFHVPPLIVSWCLGFVVCRPEQLNNPFRPYA